MARERIKWSYLATLLVAGTLLVGSGLAQVKGERQTLEGTISDTTCGIKHAMMKNATDKQCTLGCAKMGSKYALVVGDKVYTLEGNAGNLEKLAGEKARVTGTVEGTTVQVASVAKLGK